MILENRQARAEPFRSFLRDFRACEPMSEAAAERAAAAVLGALDVQLSGLSATLANLLRTCPVRFGAGSIDREALIALVARETCTTRREAERLARSVLASLRARLGAEERGQIAAHLGGLAGLWN